MAAIGTAAIGMHGIAVLPAASGGEVHYTVEGFLATSFGEGWNLPKGVRYAAVNATPTPTQFGTFAVAGEVVPVPFVVATLGRVTRIGLVGQAQHHAAESMGLVTRIGAPSAFSAHAAPTLGGVTTFGAAPVAAAVARTAGAGQVTAIGAVGAKRVPEVVFAGTCATAVGQPRAVAIGAVAGRSARPAIGAVGATCFFRAQGTRAAVQFGAVRAKRIPETQTAPVYETVIGVFAVRPVYRATSVAPTARFGAAKVRRDAC